MSGRDGPDMVPCIKARANDRTEQSLQSLQTDRGSVGGKTQEKEEGGTVVGFCTTSTSSVLTNPPKTEERRGKDNLPVSMVLGGGG
jgi:hypothetical protein